MENIMNVKDTTETPSISVIVPHYNKVKEINQSLHSILNQTINEFELIIIDGGSTDGSLEAIKPYLDDSRVR